jgi:hypothetical protein
MRKVFASHGFFCATPVQSSSNVRVRHPISICRKVQAGAACLDELGDDCQKTSGRGRVGLSSLTHLRWICSRGCVGEFKAFGRCGGLSRVLACDRVSGFQYATSQAVRRRLKPRLAGRCRTKDTLMSSSAWSNWRGFRAAKVKRHSVGGGCNVVCLRGPRSRILSYSEAATKRRMTSRACGRTAWLSSLEDSDYRSAARLCLSIAHYQRCYAMFEMATAPNSGISRGVATYLSRE